MDGSDLLAAEAWAALLLLSAVKAAFVLALAAALAHGLRRHAAATRHLVWAVAFTAALAMPGLLVLVPGWEVPVLPAEVTALWEAEPDPAPVGAVMGWEVPAAAVPAALPLSVLFVIVWAAGALVVAGRWLAGVVGARVLTARARPLREPAWDAATARAAARLGLRRPVALRVSGTLRSPMTWGVRRPVVLLPTSAAAWTEERREVVLMHELGHICRRDSLTQWLAQSALVLHWFNPLAWRAYRHLLAEREHACDDLVLATGLRPSVYAEHLLQLARTLGREPRAAFALLPMARPSQVESRLRAILDDQGRRDRLSRGLLTVVGLLVLALLLPVAALDPVARPPAPPVLPAPPAFAHAAPLPPTPPRPPVPPHRAPPPAPSAPAAAPAPAPVPTPAPQPAAASRPAPAPVSPVEVKRARAVALGHAGSSVRPAPLAEQIHAQARQARRARLDAAFAYEMREAQRDRPRVVVVERVLVALDDAASWEALDAQADALAARVEALREDAEGWDSLDWIEHEALPSLRVASEASASTEGVDTPGARVYRRVRPASESCDEAGAASAPTLH